MLIGDTEKPLKSLSSFVILFQNNSNLFWRVSGNRFLCGFKKMPKSKSASGKE